MWVLRLRLTARLRSRRFSLLRRFFLALWVCGISQLSPESGNRLLDQLKTRIITVPAAQARGGRREFPLQRPPIHSRLRRKRNRFEQFHLASGRAVKQLRTFGLDGSRRRQQGGGRRRQNGLLAWFVRGWGDRFGHEGQC